jgi:hypothetical protein
LLLIAPRIGDERLSFLVDLPHGEEILTETTGPCLVLWSIHSRLKEGGRCHSPI